MAVVTTIMFIASVILSSTFLVSGTSTDSLSRLLKGGPVARVDNRSNGKFGGITSIVDIDAPPELVWKILTDFSKYDEFMPRVEEVEEKCTPNRARCTLQVKIDTPIISTAYVSENTLNKAKWEVKAKIVSGDVKNSTFAWKLRPLANGRTRVTYSGSIRNFSGIIRSMDDEQQTITIGVNMASFISTLNALKARCKKAKR